MTKVRKTLILLLKTSCNLSFYIQSNIDKQPFVCDTRFLQFTSLYLRILSSNLLIITKCNEDSCTSKFSVTNELPVCTDKQIVLANTLAYVPATTFGQ